MLPLYEENKDSPEIYLKKSTHLPPHLHKSIECVYVTEGTLELGTGHELFHMETGDFAIIFPDLIHHYQVFDPQCCMSLYLLISPALSGIHQPVLQNLCPKNPVISSQNLHPDILYIMNSLRRQASGELPKDEFFLYQAYLQIILARSLPFYELIKKDTIGSDDIIYQTVSYIAAHFKEHFTLTDMARDLGFSPYALSRVFSGTFHKNFNQYLNETRLDYACALLSHTDQTITEAYENAGFDSQRTFNRVFRQRYHLSPRQYRTMGNLP